MAPQMAGVAESTQQMPPLPPNPTGVAVLATSFVGIFIDLIVIGLRLWSRKIKRMRLNAGDYLIIAAWIFAFADALRKIWAYKWGVGLHMWELLESDPTHLMDAGAITFAGYPIWLICISCIKLSILVAYTEFFFCLTWFMRCVYVTMALCVIFFVGFTIATFLQCTPIQFNWDPSVPGGHCVMERKDGFYLVGGCNLFLDVVIVLLPLPVVWTLSISKLKKLAVSAMFGLGFVIVIIVGLRFHLMKLQNDEDFLHDGEIAGIYNSMEIYLGMISACLPFLSPSIARMGSSFSESRIRLYLQSVTGGSEERKSSDARSSEADSVEFVDGRKRSPKDPYAVSVVDRDEEYAVCGRGDEFVTVPEQWPSDGKPRRNWETVHANDLARGEK